MAGKASFIPPVIEDNPDGWGPCAIPTAFKDIPYQPFSKGDRLGKVKWTLFGLNSLGNATSLSDFSPYLIHSKTNFFILRINLIPVLRAPVSCFHVFIPGNVLKIRETFQVKKHFKWWKLPRFLVVKTILSYLETFFLNCVIFFSGDVSSFSKFNHCDHIS